MQKKFKLSDVILSVICVVFVAEAAAPVASIGNSQYFWWILMIVAFLLPYGLIAAELGTTYEGDGGIYDWVTKAYGHKMGARVSWFYWINYPLWMASLAVMCPTLISISTGLEIGLIPSIIIELIFIWIVTFIAFYPVCDSIIILNVCAVIKVLLAVLVGALGVYYVAKNGFVNDMSPHTFLPSFDTNSLSYISVIVFNLLGFEVVCTFSDDMDDPKKQIPQAIVAGGLVIAAIYLFGGFGIGAAIPTSEIDTGSGLIDAVSLITGQTSGIFIACVSLLFMITLFGNMISWAMGVNSVAAYAAENNDMPKFFAKKSAKNDMPTGAAIMNGIVATIVVLIAPLMPSENLFWAFFALNLVMFLMSYIPIFPAFLKLRKIDPDTPRPFRVPGGDGVLKIVAIVPVILIVVALIFTAIPLSFDAETLANVLPTTIGSIVFIVIGELMIIFRGKK